MRKVLFAIYLLLFLPTFANANTISKDSLKWSQRMAISVMKRYPKAWQMDNQTKPKLDYKPTFALLSFEKLYKITKNETYHKYITDYIGIFVDSTGVISHYEKNEYNIDYLMTGNLIFDLYEDTNQSRYLTSMNTFKSQIESQPRTTSGGFWHKNIYSNQMWLDGIYMGTPFYSRFTKAFEAGKNYDDIIKQFELIHNNSFDAKTKLPYHAWDESKQIAWADKSTGNSPTIWSRGVGWYAMALVDVLDNLPKEHPKRKELIGYLNEVANALKKCQDKSGLWHQVVDKKELEGNYLEASGSAMFAYTFAKGVSKGYLPKKFTKIANKTFDGILKNLVIVDSNGEIHLNQISQGIGLGGNPFRDGSNKYYVDSKKNTDNSIGVGAFILAALALNR